MATGGLKVPAKQPKKGRLWLNDGSCVRLGPEYRNHVWSYDFVHCRMDDGKAFRTLNNEPFSAIGPRTMANAIRVSRKLSSTDVIDALTDLFVLRGPPAYIRSDNGPEFVAQAVRDWIAAVGARTAYIEPGSPWENGYIESFNARFRDELLTGEVFYSLREAKSIVEGWRRHYNTVRPHSALGYRVPAPEIILAVVPRPVMH
jgi:transposase InsO family protein